MDRTSARIASVDILRGLAVVLMAIDHVRVYSGLPAGGPTAGIFFTRWVTHFWPKPPPVSRITTRGSKPPKPAARHCRRSFY